MKYTICYSSKSGNTKMLAEGIQEVLSKKGDGCLCEISNQISCSDTIFVGFWTDRGTCDAVSKEFLKALENKKVFLFGTAGFGGKDEYFANILERVKANLNASNTIIGEFMCIGKMPVATKEKYQKMLASTEVPEKIQFMIDNFNKAITHPDQDDISKLQELAVNALENM